MKIGILTFHSQLNYGGVLQCWALQHALQAMGHEVQVIDRWLTPDNLHLERGYNRYGLKDWIRFCLRVATGGGDFACWFRHWRTKRFIQRQLRITPYHFYNWSDVDSSVFDFDVIVVGSDQVWHGGEDNWSYPTPNPYLLKDAPKMKAIAYAASFGMKSLPHEIDWVSGFKRFDAISVRESEGVNLVESAGAKATHVVDPTLLLSRETWSKLGNFRKHPHHVVCYCLAENIERQKTELEAWAQKTKRYVTIISEGGALRKFPKKFGEFLMRPYEIILGIFRRSRVRVVMSYGPNEFYRAFAEAEECITDSFHAVMFSYICNCNTRFLRPLSDERVAMFARIEEFVTTSIRGDFFATSLSSAIHSFENDPRITFIESAINVRRDFSRHWLENALQATATPSTHV